MPENGKVILAECVLPEAPDTGLATKNVVHIDVIMLAHNPGGKERTEKEFLNLAKGAGFKHFNKACCAYNTWIMELLKWEQKEGEFYLGMCLHLIEFLVCDLEIPFLRDA